MDIASCDQVLEREKMIKRFHDVISQIDQALDGISFDKLEISEEVREQVQSPENNNLLL